MAMRKDEKWKKIELDSCHQNIASMYEFSMLQFHCGYSDMNPRNFERNNPLSWHCKLYDDDGQHSRIVKGSNSRKIDPVKVQVTIYYYIIYHIIFIMHFIHVVVFNFYYCVSSHVFNLQYR